MTSPPDIPEIASMTDMPGGAPDRSAAKDDPRRTAPYALAPGARESSGERMEPGEASRALLALCRVYDPAIDRFDKKGYPVAWKNIKHLVRAAAGYRCLRCGHPYTKGEGEWSFCDPLCTHDGPIRWCEAHEPEDDRNWTYLETLGGHPAGDGIVQTGPSGEAITRYLVQAQWRVLTVHHLDGDKANCRWWNLVPLCQRDHLQIQRVVKMNAPWPWRHTDWFKPYAAAFYAFKYLDQDLPRTEVDARLEELLALGAHEAAVERMPL